jgi:hypothetical protein
LPFTRFNSTQPPAAWILLYSVLLQGLWSNESTSTLPLTLAMARESPTLACYRDKESHKSNICFSLCNIQFRSCFYGEDGRSIIKRKVVPVHNQSVTTPWRRTGEWMYKSMFFTLALVRNE